MYKILTNKSYSNGKELHNIEYLVENGQIGQIGQIGQTGQTGQNIKKAPAADSTTETFDLTNYHVMPGMIDLHVHGAMGHDVMDATYEAIAAISSHKLKEGCTAFCPTTLTASTDDTIKAIKNVRAAMDIGVDGAKIIGAFLEGPFINTKYRGAHVEKYVREMDLTAATEFIQAGDGCVASIAVAPEQPQALSAIRAFKEMGVQVRLGHSAATLEQAEQAVQAGANMAIHTFNAMSPFHHREPGLVGAVFSNEKLIGELICDLIHVHHSACKALVNAKHGEGIALVTDCMAAGGLSDGEYKLGELNVKVVDGASRLADGSLAGSTTNMLTCLKHMHKNIHVPLAEASEMATATPAKALGIFNKIGSLDVGKSADIIAFDDDFNIVFVMVDGVVKINRLPC
ncbi:MAG: N-acetylglucosamine-6-phosphate deacetylase [Defluviitaleaceae bacterium]|nr:N-acetylglucosamine-6-phosphate deacetylase [Defluviitaleaceae bacterium]